MPRQTPFPYRFEQDQLWNYRSLKAPFDFEVLHPEAQVQDQIDRIKNEHAPYFILNQDIARQQKRLFSQLLDEQVKVGRHDTQYSELVNNPGAYEAFGQALLNKLYALGITNPEEEVFKDNPGYIYVVSGANERRAPVRELLTLRSAQKFLTDTLPYSTLREPELMLPLLEKSLAPNLLYSDSLSLAGKRRKLAEIRSTGITVRKGEVLVQRNELIFKDIYQKLVSLRSHYDLPGSQQTISGYFILALLTFGAFFYWLLLLQTTNRLTRESLLVLPILVLIHLLLVNFGSQIGPAVPLLLPIPVLPLLLRRSHDLPTGLMCWGVLMVLTTVSLDWDAAWLLLQIAGLLGALWLLLPAASWTARLLAVFSTAALQTLVCVGLSLAGRLPDSLSTADVALFLGVSALASLAVFPASQVLENVLKGRP